MAELFFSSVAGDPYCSAATAFSNPKVRRLATALRRTAARERQRVGAGRSIWDISSPELVATKSPIAGDRSAPPCKATPKGAQQRRRRDRAYAFSLCEPSIPGLTLTQRAFGALLDWRLRVGRWHLESPASLPTAHGQRARTRPHSTSASESC